MSSLCWYSNTGLKRVSSDALRNKQGCSHPRPQSSSVQSPLSQKLQKRVFWRCSHFSRPAAQRCKARRTYALSTRSEAVLSRTDVDSRIDKALSLINLADKLVPSEDEKCNVPLAIWEAIQEIPPKNRAALLDKIHRKDIVKLWGIAGLRYGASPDQMQAVMGDNFSLWTDFPEDADEVVTYAGRAAIKHRLFGLADRFKKVFFLQPRTLDLYGRVLLGKGPLGNFLYPLYYKGYVEPRCVPATRELTDIQLEYLEPELLGLDPVMDLPLSGSWPRPARQLYPFSGGLTDYLRAVGPGVYVGLGWKEARLGVDTGRQFLYFMLVREY